MIEIAQPNWKLAETIIREIKKSFKVDEEHDIEIEIKCISYDI